MQFMVVTITMYFGTLPTLSGLLDAHILLYIASCFLEVSLAIHRGFCAVCVYFTAHLAN